MGHWSVPLWRLLQPIVSGVLSEEGGGSLAMPALRDAIRRQGASPPPPPPLPPPPSSVVAARSSAGGGGAEEVDAPPPPAADVLPLQFENFHPVSSKPTPRLDARGARRPPPPMPPRPLSRNHCAELMNVQGSLQRLTDPGRRARATALAHLSGVLRTAGRAHGAVLCAELGVPRHASALLSDPEAEVPLGRRPAPTLRRQTRRARPKPQTQARDPDPEPLPLATSRCASRRCASSCSSHSCTHSPRPLAPLPPPRRRRCSAPSGSRR